MLNLILFCSKLMQALSIFKRLYGAMLLHYYESFDQKKNLKTHTTKPILASCQMCIVFTILTIISKLYEDHWDEKVVLAKLNSRKVQALLIPSISHKIVNKDLIYPQYCYYCVRKDDGYFIIIFVNIIVLCSNKNYASKEEVCGVHSGNRRR